MDLKTRKQVTILYDGQRDLPMQLEHGGDGFSAVRDVLGFSRLRGHFYADGFFCCHVRQSYGYGEAGGEYFVYEHCTSRFDALFDWRTMRYVVCFDLPVVGRYAQIHIENPSPNAITVSGICYAI